MHQKPHKNSHNVCQTKKKYYLCTALPQRPFNYGEMVEWSITAVLKTAVPRGTGGSNPSLSANKGVNQRVTRFTPFSAPQKTMLPKIYSPKVLDMEFSVCSILNLLMNPFLLLSIDVTSNSKHLSVRLGKCIYLLFPSILLVIFFCRLISSNTRVTFS